MEVTTRVANYDHPADARAVSDLLNGYALDQFGNSGPLDEDVRANLCANLAKVPGAFSVVASVGDTPVGLINAFQGFSTFQCKPLINVHDVFVDPAHRRKGVTQAMMAKVEEVARARGCCKLTLEVLSNNPVAMASYAKYGFGQYELDPALGTAQFWEKKGGARRGAGGRRRGRAANASNARFRNVSRHVALPGGVRPARGVGPAGWAEISVNIKLLYCERRRADARRRAYCRRAAGRTNHDPSLNASVVSAHEAELEPAEEVPVLPRLVLAVVGAGDDLAECDAEGGRDDVVDAENTEGEGQDVGCVEAGEGEDGLPQELPASADLEVQVDALREGGEDASETGLAGAGHARA